MSSRLMLPLLERLLTPPSDILGHYEARDKDIKAREEAYTRCGCYGWGLWVFSYDYGDEGRKDLLSDLI